MSCTGVKIKGCVCVGGGGGGGVALSSGHQFKKFH